MFETNKKIMYLVNLGLNQKTSGQYDRAYHYFYKALEYNPKHYLVRNAIAELQFIDREYLTAANNFYIAAVDESYHLNLDLIVIDDWSEKNLLILKEREVEEAHNLLSNYALRTGFSLFAHQHDNPIAKTPQQAAINIRRNQYDSCGYSSFTKADLFKIKRTEEKVAGIGYDFLDTMNQKNNDDNKSVLPLEFLMDFFRITY